MRKKISRKRIFDPLPAMFHFTWKFIHDEDPVDKCLWFFLRTD